MFKQVLTLSLLAAAATLPLAGTAQAGEASASGMAVQGNKQTAVNIGYGNHAYQENNQVGIQNVDAYNQGYGSAAADSKLLQMNEQTGVNNGYFNSFDQRNTQVDVQDIQAEQNGYPSYYGW
jgi:phospholipase/lecithinase/hemolysin